MNYELWEIVDDGYELMPFILINKYNNYTDAYIDFQKLIKTKPCCIIVANKGELK